jgi:hypothetical protein
MREKARVALFNVCGLVLPALLMTGPASAQMAAPTVTAAPTASLATATYKARIEQTRYDVSSGVPFAVRVQLSPVDVPSGSFVTVNVERLSGPQGGRIDSLAGIPDTSVTLSAPGTYRLSVRVAFVTKGSCGGVEATDLLESEIEAVAR